MVLILNIITDNYLWFIIAGVVLLLITIGYYAEKTGFGKFKLSDNKTDQDLNNNELDINKLEQVPIMETIDVEEPLIIEEPIISEPTVSTSLQVPINEITLNNDNSVPEVGADLSKNEGQNVVTDVNNEDVWKF